MKALSVPDVAARLGITEEAVTELIKKGDIIAIEIGGYGVARKYLVTEEAFDTYKKKKELPQIVTVKVTIPRTGVEDLPTKTPKRSVERRSTEIPPGSMACPTSSPDEWYRVNVEVERDYGKESLSRRLLRSYLKDKTVRDIMDIFSILRVLKLSGYRIYNRSDKEVFPDMTVEELEKRNIQRGTEKTVEIDLIFRRIKKDAASEWEEW